MELSGLAWLLLILFAIASIAFVAVVVMLARYVSRTIPLEWFHPPVSMAVRRTSTLALTGLTLVLTFKSCTNPGRIREVKPDMTRTEVVEILGEPHRTSTDRFGMEIWEYNFGWTLFSNHIFGFGPEGFVKYLD